MSEWEEKLNDILSSPGEMEKLMDMARSLSGSLGLGESVEKPEPASLFGDLDPQLLSAVSRIMGEYRSSKTEKNAVLGALKPYLRENRRQALEKATQIAKIAHLAKLAMTELGGDQHG